MTDISKLQLDKIFQALPSLGTSSTDEKTDVKQSPYSDQVSKAPPKESNSISTPSGVGTPSLPAPTTLTQGGSGVSSTGNANLNASLSEDLVLSELTTLLLLESIEAAGAKGTTSNKQLQDNLADAIMQYTHAHGPIPEGNKAQAMATIGESFIRSADPNKKNEKLGRAVQGLKAKAVSHTNPEFDVLQDVVTKQKQKSGLSNEQSSDQAIDELLQQLDEYIDQASDGVPNGANKTNLTSQAIVQNLQSMLGSDPVSKGTAQGIVEGLQLVNGMFTAIKGFSAINPTSAAVAANKAKNVQTARQALNAMSDIMQAALDVVQTTNLDKPHGAKHSRKAEAPSADADMNVQHKHTKADSSSKKVKGKEKASGKDDGAGDTDEVQPDQLPVPGTLPPGGTVIGGQPMTVVNYMKTIMTIIADLQELLAKIAQSESADASENEQIQQQLNHIQYQVKMKQLDEQMKQIKEMDSPLMRFLSIFLQIFFAVGALLSSIFTGGTSFVLEEVVTSVIIDLVTQAVMMTLQQTGALTKLFNDITEGIDKMLGSNAPKWLQDLVQTIVMALMIVAVAVTGGQAASSIDSAVVKAAARQAALQVTTTVISSSNIFQDVANIGCDAAGASASTKQAVDITVSVIGAVAMAGASMKINSVWMQELADIPGVLNESETALQEKIGQFTAYAKQASRLLEGIGYVGQGTLNITQAVQIVRQADIQLQIADLQKLADIIKAMIDVLQDMLKSIQGAAGIQGIMDCRQSLGNLWNNIIQSNQASLAGIMAANN